MDMGDKGMWNEGGEAGNRVGGSAGHDSDWQRKCRPLSLRMPVARDPAADGGGQERPVAPKVRARRRPAGGGGMVGEEMGWGRGKGVG